MRTRAKYNLPAVASSSIGGVEVKRHILDLEAQSLAGLARRVGMRLRRWIKQMPEEMVCLRPSGAVDEQGKPILVPMADADGNAVLEPWLPPEDFRENAEWYSKAVLGLLKEQRERAKLAGKAGGPPLSDEEYELELEALRTEALAAMSESDLELELAMRRGVAATRDSESKKRDI